MDRALLKSNAKQQLGGGIFQTNWINGLLVMLIAGAIISVSGVVVVGPIIVFGPVMYGVSKIFLKLVYGEGSIDIAMLFDGFKEDLTGNILLGLMQSIFVFLWSLLFVIPGIIKSFGYAMCFYIKAEHPDYDWKRCLSESEALMQGHKMELFVLELSFLGWMIVGSLACGIGTLWVAPYMQCTSANFYAKLTAQQPAEGIAE